MTILPTQNSFFEEFEKRESENTQKPRNLYSNTNKTEGLGKAAFIEGNKAFSKARKGSLKGKYFEFMSTRIKGGEGNLYGISKKCDWYIGRGGIRKKTEVPKTIFLSTTSKDHFALFVDEILPTLKEDFVLIIGGSSRTFPVGDKCLGVRYERFMTEDNIKRYPTLMENKYLKGCFVENLDRADEGLNPLPIGILPYQVKIEPLAKVSFKNRLIKAMCIQRPGVGPQFKERREVTRKCKTVWRNCVSHRDKCTRVEFLDFLRKHSFCICVHGNGIDPCPKAWEALSMGCIPIMKHSSLDEAYSRFPVVFVDSWDKKNITLNKLQKWRDELRPRFENPKLRAKVIKMLGVDYWWDIILSKLQS
jgi:hypothetical protein